LVGSVWFFEGFGAGGDVIEAHFFVEVDSVGVAGGSTEVDLLELWFCFGLIGGVINELTAVTLASVFGANVEFVEISGVGGFGEVIGS